MKLGQEPKLDKRNKKTSKKLMMMSCQQVMSLSFFQFMANLQQSRSRIPDAQPVKFTYSSIITFYLTKLKTELKISNTAFTLLL